VRFDREVLPGSVIGIEGDLPLRVGLLHARRYQQARRQRLAHVGAAIGEGRVEQGDDIFARHARQPGTAQPSGDDVHHAQAHPGRFRSRIDGGRQHGTGQALIARRGRDRRRLVRMLAQRPDGNDDQQCGCDESADQHCSTRVLPRRLGARRQHDRRFAGFSRRLWAGFRHGLYRQ